MLSYIISSLNNQNNGNDLCSYGGTCQLNSNGNTCIGGSNFFLHCVIVLRTAEKQGRGASSGAPKHFSGEGGLIFEYHFSRFFRFGALEPPKFPLGWATGGKCPEARQFFGPARVLKPFFISKYQIDKLILPRGPKFVSADVIVLVYL